ncbi:MAG: calcium-binding protein [Thermoleophilaceae bacterium]
MPRFARLRPCARRCAATAGLVAAVAGALAFPAAAARDDLIFVSRAMGGAAADGGSEAPVLSGDGRLVAFYSGADNLSPDDNNDYGNIFVRDIQAATTALVSRATGAGGAGANDRSFDPAISVNGRSVAFESGADNLSTGDNNSFINVFVRDLQASTTTLASITFDNSAGGNGDARSPSISADGRFVAFRSDADNLSTGDNNSFTNIFVRDLHPKASTTRLASIRPDGQAGANGRSFEPSISADGRFVAFMSEAENLSAEDSNLYFNIYVRDLVANTTTLVSRATGPSGAVADASSYTPAISADGGFVAFQSDADNLSAEDDNAVDNVFVRDLVATTTTLVSRAAGPAGAGADGRSRSPSISSDGRFVAFRTEADNLSTEDRNDFDNVFVRDLVATTTTLVSRAAGPAGAGADNDSSSPAISGVARFVAYDSEADNLSVQDDDEFRNVFARDVCRRATLVGTPRRDVLRGTARRDVIVALAGNDRVIGRGGADLICLGSGRDRGLGGGGADLIDGGPGNDRLLGGSARDRLLGRAGRDLLIGGLGRDRLLGGAGRNRLVGGAGRDACRGGTARLC